MTSVWFAASGSGEDGDEYDVHEVFATREAAQAHCDRPDKPTWEHRYVQEWEVMGSMLTAEERDAVKWCRDNIIPMSSSASAFAFIHTAALRSLLERLA